MKTCRRGHALTPANTYLFRGHHQCRICRKLNAQDRRVELAALKVERLDEKAARRLVEAHADGVLLADLCARFRLGPKEVKRVLDEARQ